MALSRKVVSDYTLSDGTFLPAGSIVSVNADKMHFNDERYVNASEFDGFRFVREDDSETAVANRLTTTGVDFVTFGTGRHAWCVQRRRYRWD